MPSGPTSFARFSPRFRTFGGVALLALLAAGACSNGPVPGGEGDDASASGSGDQDGPGATGGTSGSTGGAIPSGTGGAFTGGVTGSTGGTSGGPACGAPGQPCCAANTCANQACCVPGNNGRVCVAAGQACSFGSMAA